MAATSRPWLRPIHAVLFLVILAGAWLLTLGPVERWRLVEYVLPPPPPQGGSGLVIIKSSNRLYLFEDGQVIRRYDVATGREPHFTPEGRFTVINRLDDPGHPDYGPRWLGLSVPEWADRRDPPDDERAPAGHKYGIHGTDEPWSIGGYHSGGCVRLRNEDILDLYPAVEVGTPVEIRP